MLKKLKSRRLLYSIIGAVILVFCISLLVLTACSQSEEGDSIALEFAPGFINPSDANSPIEFSEEDSVVLRCASFEENERGIVVGTSKSKDMKATTLIFVKQTQIGSINADHTQIAAAPINGKEYEYDIAQARFYQVTSSSVEAAIAVYGIPYSDWQAGAINSSEKFPCCE